MKYTKILFIITLLFIISGCKKWLDVNSDPATPQSSKPEFFLAPIIAKMAYNSALDYRDVESKLTQGWANQTNLDIWERHSSVSSDAGGAMWRHVYINAGLNLEEMINKAQAVEANNLAGIGLAIKAWGFQILTDVHGPIILDEVFKDQLTFRYQDQPDVYAKVREWCQQALNHLNKPDAGDYTITLKNNDFMFGGDRNKWKKFVYAILAVQYSHLINKPDFQSKYADSVIKYVDLSFGGSSALPSAAEDATIGFVGNTSYVNDNAPGDSNPLSAAANLIGGATYGRIGQPIVNYLTGGVRGTPVINPTASSTGIVDPRLTRMINPMATGVYRGIVATKGDVPTTKTLPHVLGSVTPTTAAPFPGKYIFGQGSAAVDKPRYPIFTYAQLQFAKAEALFIKGNKGDAYTAYINGIRGHMDFVNLYGRNGTIVAPVITAAEITAYLASSEVAQNSAVLTIADIMGQKYIAQWGWAGFEQFSDMRKYHWDSNVFKQFKQLESSEFSNPGKYVYRLRPRLNSEYVWNKEALNEWGGLDAGYPYKETWSNLPN